MPNHARTAAGCERVPGHTLYVARFLISRLSSLGDVVCCLPAASALKAGFPGCHITWLADPRFAAVVECCTAVDRVVEAGPGLNLYGEEFDAAFDLQGLLKSALPIGKARSKNKLGYHWQREGSWLFSRRVLPDPTSFHIVDQYVDVARAAGGVADRADFALKPDPAAEQRVQEMLSASPSSKIPNPIPGQHGRAEIQIPKSDRGVDKPIVVLNAGAGWASKRWPTAYFARLIDDLAPFAHSVLIGSKGHDDRLAAGEVIAACRERPIDLVGRTSIKELIALISQAGAHVGGDTGSTHIAAALGRPAIGLYSITRPRRSCPYGQIERCHYEAAGLDRITPEVVLQTVLESVRR